MKDSRGERGLSCESNVGGNTGYVHHCTVVDVTLFLPNGYSGTCRFCTHIGSRQAGAHQNRYQEIAKAKEESKVSGQSGDPTRP